MVKELREKLIKEYEAYQRPEQARLTVEKLSDEQVIRLYNIIQEANKEG